MTRDSQFLTDIARSVDAALTELLPAMEVDGGGANVVSFEEGVLRLRLTGTCEFCPSRKLSASALASNLRCMVPAIREVIVEHSGGTVTANSIAAATLDGAGQGLDA